MPPVPEPAVSLIVPAYDEASRLADGYARLAPTLERLGSALEVVIVDDGSHDDTADEARRVYGALGPRVVRHPRNRGKGAAVATGIRHATGARLLVVDADMAIDPEHYPSLLAGLDEADVVPGSRADDGHIRYTSRARTWAGRGFNLLVRHYTGVRLADTQCGAKALRGGAGHLLALLATIDGFAYDAEYLHLAQRLGMRVEPRRVSWRDVGGSTVRLSRAPLDMLGDLRRIQRTAYALPAVTIPAGRPAGDLAPVAVAAGAPGAVVARGVNHDLLVVARDQVDALPALARDLAGESGVATLDQLAQRDYVPL